MSGMTIEQALGVFQRRLDACSEPECIFCKDERPALATLRAEIARLEKDAATGREIAAAFLPVMEAARPLVLNLERLRDAAKGASHEP